MSIVPIRGGRLPARIAIPVLFVFHYSVRPWCLCVSHGEKCPPPAISPSASSAAGWSCTIPPSFRIAPDRFMGDPSSAPARRGIRPSRGRPALAQRSRRGHCLASQATHRIARSAGARYSLAGRLPASFPGTDRRLCGGRYRSRSGEKEHTQSCGPGQCRAPRHHALSPARLAPFKPSASSIESLSRHALALDFTTRVFFNADIFPDPATSLTAHLAAVRSHPALLVKHLQRIYGDATTADLLLRNNQRPLITLRG